MLQPVVESAINLDSIEEQTALKKQIVENTLHALFTSNKLKPKNETLDISNVVLSLLGNHEVALQLQNYLKTFYKEMASFDWTSFVPQREQQDHVATPEVIADGDELKAKKMRKVEEIINKIDKQQLFTFHSSPENIALFLEFSHTFLLEISFQFFKATHGKKTNESQNTKSAIETFVVDLPNLIKEQLSEVKMRMSSEYDPRIIFWIKRKLRLFN